MRYLSLAIMCIAVFSVSKPARASCDLATEVLDVIPSSMMNLAYIDGFKITWKGIRYRCKKDPLFADLQTNMNLLCQIMDQAGSGAFTADGISGISGELTNIMTQLNSFDTITATTKESAIAQAEAKMVSIDSSLTAITAYKPQTENNVSKKWVKRKSSCRSSGYTPPAESPADQGGGVDDDESDDQASSDYADDIANAGADFDGMTDEEKLAAIQDMLDDGVGSEDQADLEAQMAEIQEAIAEAEAAAAAAEAAAAEEEAAAIP